MLGELICRMTGHKVDRRRVWHDGLDFRTTCSRCGHPLVRDPATWRDFDDARDIDSRRLAQRPSRR